MSSTPFRPALLIAAACTLPFGIVACGGSDDANSSDAASDSAIEGDGDASDADIAAVADCLTNRGFEVTREADQDEALVLPDEYKESVGLIESVSLGFIGDVKGTGSIGFFDDAEAAAEEDDAATGFRTDDVLAGVNGATNWNYIVTAGDDPGVESMIDACLS